MLHGKTRRGALVFDVPDVFKDATVMPLAFAMGAEGCPDQSYRDALIGRCQSTEVLDRVIEIIKSVL